MICKYPEIFCWKNVSSFCSAKATHIFSATNIRILYIESSKTVNEMTLNELIKLMMLWTTGPRKSSKMLKILTQAASSKLETSIISKEWRSSDQPVNLSNMTIFAAGQLTKTFSLRWQILNYLSETYIAPEMIFFFIIKKSTATFLISP